MLYANLFQTYNLLIYNEFFSVVQLIIFLIIKEVIIVINVVFKELAAWLNVYWMHLNNNAWFENIFGSPKHSWGHR